MYLFIYAAEIYWVRCTLERIHMCSAFMFVCRYVIMHVYILYFCNHSCEDICTSMGIYPKYVLLGRHVSKRVIAHECNRHCILKCTHFCLQKYRTIFHRTIFLLLLGLIPEFQPSGLPAQCTWRKLSDSGAIMTYNTRLLMCNAVKQKGNT